MLVIVALAGRAVVLWGLLPLLSGVGLSQRVDNKYKVVILWGGLRGAITLALALAVTEAAAIPHDVQRFIAVLATGFVLFTLLVQGLTLRPLIRVLRLDRLSPADQALRAQVLALSRRRVVEAVRTIGQEYKFDDELIANAVTTYQPDVWRRAARQHAAARIQTARCGSDWSRSPAASVSSCFSTLPPARRPAGSSRSCSRMWTD